MIDILKVGHYLIMNATIVKKIKLLYNRTIYGIASLNP